MNNSERTFAAHMAIFFHNEGVDYKLAKKRVLKAWLKAVALDHGFELGRINIVLVSDTYLLEMNRQFLQHDYYTDIITFEYRRHPLEGDLYISIDRCAENASKNSLSIEIELYRLFAHGILHLCGFQDKTPDSKRKMTAQEDMSLQKLTQQLNSTRGRVSRGTI